MDCKDVEKFIIKFLVFNLIESIIDVSEHFKEGVSNSLINDKLELIIERIGYRFNHEATIQEIKCDIHVIDAVRSIVRNLLNNKIFLNNVANSARDVDFESNPRIYDTYAFNGVELCNSSNYSIRTAINYIVRKQLELTDIYEILDSHSKRVFSPPPTQTTVNDSPEAKAKTGRKEGQKITNETKELLYLFWVKHGRLGSGDFESLIKRKLSNNSVIDGLILVFEDGLPFTSKNEAIGVKAEFDKKNLVFSGLAKMISSEFRKR